MDKRDGEIPVPSDRSRRQKPRGADIGNGYTIGFKELKSLSKLQKAGIDTDHVYGEPRFPPTGAWTLGEQMTVMEQRRYKTQFAKKNALLLLKQRQQERQN